jgi:hypothetical protein
MIGEEMIRKPTAFVRAPEVQKKLKVCLRAIVSDIVIDVNGEVDPLGDDFDYRGKLRDADWIRKLARDVVGNYLKLVQRGRIQSLKTEWQKLTA